MHNRAGYSAAVVRAATATELAVNFAIRQEFATRQLPAEFIESLLVWANGVHGKIDRLLIPLLKGNDKHSKVKQLRCRAKKINKKRNDIVHSGHFSTKKEVSQLIEDCREFVHGIVHLYDTTFNLIEKKSITRK